MVVGWVLLLDVLGVSLVIAGLASGGVGTDNAAGAPDMAAGGGRTGAAGGAW